ncbi:cell wall protein AWA1 [Coregonus clupeaformis]|uniref:cell wall protein AWA1 n=1 Tax=Coregonus clupeaformis TaxID=59861 RepID=UPI001BE0154E|nr:cell wall protein AWA1 [Coregonus clupeaformis]
MAFGIHLGIVLLCTIFSGHLQSAWASRDGYPQDQIRPASSTSGSVQSDATPRGTGPNTHNQRLSLGGSAPIFLQPAPRTLGISGSIASGNPLSHNKRNTLASRTSGQSVTNPSEVKTVSRWEAKGIQPKAFRPFQPRSRSSGSVQISQGSRLIKSSPQNSVAQSGSYQYLRGSAYTPDLQAPSHGSLKTSFRPAPLSFGSTEGGSATNGYKPRFSHYVKPYQSRYASASRSGSTSSQYAQTSDQRIDGTSRSSSIPMSSLASISYLFSPSSMRSGSSYGAYKPISTPGATLSQSLFTSNQGGGGVTYSQNVLAANQKPSGTTSAQSNHRQVSGQMGRYQPSYAASSGPIASLFSSSRAGSYSTYIQNATIQKPSGSKPVPSQPRQSYQPSNTPNAVKSIPSSARGPTQSLFFSSYGPTQSGTSSGTSATSQSLAPATIHIIPKHYGGASIRRLQDPVRSVLRP